MVQPVYAVHWTSPLSDDMGEVGGLYFIFISDIGPD
jgi:hypothetical protein